MGHVGESDVKAKTVGKWRGYTKDAGEYSGGGKRGTTAVGGAQSKDSTDQIKRNSLTCRIATILI